MRVKDVAECAICTFHGHDPEPLAVAYEIEYDAGRDGLPWRQVYACPECYRQGTPTPPAPSLVEAARKVAVWLQGGDRPIPTDEGRGCYPHDVARYLYAALAAHRAAEDEQREAVAEDDWSVVYAALVDARIVLKVYKGGDDPTYLLVKRGIDALARLREVDGE